MIKKFNLYCIDINKNLFETLKKLNESCAQCLIVIDNKKCAVGTITDGDLRRGLLKGLKLTDSIKNIFNKKFYFIKQHETKIFNKKKNSINQDKKIIPVLNSKKQVVDIIINFKFDNPNKIQKNICAVIMAGGRGKRLAPLTNFLPKPLIPYKEKSLIEHILEFFESSKIKKVFISLNYKDSLIRSFLSEIKLNINISYLRELKPLGTAGVLYKLKDKNKIFVITNCDNLIDIDLYNLVEYHKINKFDITVVGFNKLYKIPYGVCKLKNNKLIEINEKPESSLLINSGFYVVNSEIFRLIKKNENLSFVELIQRSIKKNKKIGVYPISSESWTDFGQTVEYTK